MCEVLNDVSINSLNLVDFHFFKIGWSPSFSMSLCYVALVLHSKFTQALLAVVQLDVAHSLVLTRFIVWQRSRLDVNIKTTNLFLCGNNKQCCNESKTCCIFTSRHNTRSVIAQCFLVLGSLTLLVFAHALALERDWMSI